MKRLLLLFLFASAGAALLAQTTDPAKVQEYQQRFAQGRELEQQGKLAEARTVFDGILAEEPKARGSLREAGRISVQLGDLAKADDYFLRLHALEPTYPEALEQLIQINQALKRDIKVERLLGEFRALHDSGKIPEFTASPDFVRETIHTGADQRLVFTQSFTYNKDAPTVYILEQMSSNQITRQLMLGYNADETTSLRAQKPELKDAEVFVLLENIIANGKPTRVDIYKQFIGLPDYGAVRQMLLLALSNPPKPLYSQAAAASDPNAAAGAAQAPAPDGR